MTYRAGTRVGIFLRLGVKADIRRGVRAPGRSGGGIRRQALLNKYIVTKNVSTAVMLVTAFLRNSGMLIEGQCHEALATRAAS